MYHFSGAYYYIPADSANEIHKADTIVTQFNLTVSISSYSRINKSS